MNWQDIRRTHPNRWLLVEALRAHSEAQRRLLDDLVVLEAYDDSALALRGYARFHRQRPERELYVLHTSQREPMIEERRWLGIRASAQT